MTMATEDVEVYGRSTGEEYAMVTCDAALACNLQLQPVAVADCMRSILMQSVLRSVKCQQVRSYTH